MKVSKDPEYLVQRRHPELPADWNPSKGLDVINDAFCGLTGLAQQRIAEMGIQVLALLLQKNAEYGDSALAPVRNFSRGLPASAGIRIRLDDKISRMARGSGDGGREDPVFDMAGYLILLLLAEEDEA